jgi:signal transduction histidine kinase/ActR/RegA family two-component response regulator/HPt (histidine-containing phosphotransfer) domain-containing protein
LKQAKVELAAAQQLAAANAALKYEISWRQRVQQQLQVLNETLEKRVAERTEAAEAANHAKSDFLANMSHEIRTPLTAIIGFAEMLLRPNIGSDERTECVQTIRRNARHLLELINDILDLSKIEAGKMKVERAACDLPRLISDVVSLLRPRAGEKGLQFDVVLESPVPKTIQTDGLRLRQVLVNLLGNAIKFTAEGKISMRLRYGAEPGKSTLAIEIADTGIGINAKQLKTIFGRFSQADSSTQRRFGGTGLGLAISQKLAELLGGGIRAESTPGAGSKFMVWIDCGPEAGGELVPQLSDSDLQGSTDATPTNDILIRGKILLVEDGRDNQRLLSSHLETGGAQVTIAENGIKAIELVPAQRFDLILMDMQMPQMDGYTATRELRKRGFRVPIIALTANAMAEDRAKCMAAGCTDYLSKPIGWETLMSKVSQYLGVKISAAQKASPAPVKANPAPVRANPVPGGKKIRSTLADRPRMKKIIAEFVHDLSGDVANIRKLMRKKDLEGVRSLAHQLRGAGGSYGFDRLSELAEGAEESIKAADNLQSVEKKINALIDMIEHIEGFEEPKAKARNEGVAA